MLISQVFPAVTRRQIAQPHSLTLLASLSNRLPENCRAYCPGKAPPSTFNYAKIVQACSFYINTVLTVCLFTRGVVQWMEGWGAQVTNTVVVSRSRRVVTLNREFLFFSATYTNWNACCGEKKDNHSTIYARRGLSACFTRVALFILSSFPDLNKIAVVTLSFSLQKTLSFYPHRWLQIRTYPPLPVKGRRGSV